MMGLQKKEGIHEINANLLLLSEHIHRWKMFTLRNSIKTQNGDGHHKPIESALIYLNASVSFWIIYNRASRAPIYFTSFP